MEYLTPIHQEILNTLQQSNTQIVLNNHRICRSNAIDGYTMSWRDPENHYRKTTIVLCLETIKRNYTDWVGEINRTLSHESVHVAQICKQGNGYIKPLGFRRDVEREAFDMQDNPDTVVDVLKKYCM